MKRMRQVWGAAGVAMLLCVVGEAHAVKVTYQGTATITTDTSNAAVYTLSAAGLGFADGTNLQGLTVDFSIMFDDSSFDSDSSGGASVGFYEYLGASSYSYQVTGGNLISTELLRLIIQDNVGSGVDSWTAYSLFTEPTQGGLFFEGPDTVFDDDNLRTVIDPADFTSQMSFAIIGDPIGAEWFINADIEQVSASIVPIPAAAGAGLVLLGGLLTKRDRRRK